MLHFLVVSFIPGNCSIQEDFACAEMLKYFPYNEDFKHLQKKL